MGKYNIDLKLRFKVRKRLCVGGSYAIRSRADIPLNTIVVNGSRKIYIPGSTIKGILRTSFIKVSGLIGINVKSFRVNPEELLAIDDYTARLFGKPEGGESRILVEPAYLEYGEVETHTHIAIEDDTGVVREGALYTIEYIPVGSEFHSWVRGRGLELEDIRGLLTAILELRYCRIGRAGLIDVDIVRDESRMPEEALKDAIVSKLWSVVSR